MLLVEVLKVYSVLLAVIFPPMGPTSLSWLHTKPESCTECSTCFMPHLLEKLLWYVQANVMNLQRK